MLSFKVLTLFAVLLVAQQTSGASIASIMGNVTDVAVAGQKFILQLEVAVGASKVDSVSTKITAEIITAMGKSLVDLATAMSQAESNVQLGSPNVLGDILNGMSNGLYALGNSIANAGYQLEAAEQA